MFVAIQVEISVSSLITNFNHESSGGFIFSLQNSFMINVLAFPLGFFSSPPYALILNPHWKIAWIKPLAFLLELIYCLDMWSTINWRQKKKKKMERENYLCERSNGNILSSFLGGWSTEFLTFMLNTMKKGCVLAV